MRVYLFNRYFGFSPAERRISIRRSSLLARWVVFVKQETYPESISSNLRGTTTMFSDSFSERYLAAGTHCSKTFSGPRLASTPKRTSVWARVRPVPPNKLSLNPKAAGRPDRGPNGSMPQNGIFVPQVVCLHIPCCSWLPMRAFCEYLLHRCKRMDRDHGRDDWPAKLALNRQPSSRRTELWIDTSLNIPISGRGTAAGEGLPEQPSAPGGLLVEANEIFVCAPVIFLKQ